MKISKQPERLDSIFPYILVVGGLAGLIASLLLSYDTLAISQNQNFAPSCNLNPILSCGNVINATGDKIFGLPFPFYGIAAFAVLVSIGVTILAGAKFKRWFWLAFQAATTLGTIGAYLLLLKSIFKIHSLCPFCLSVDVVTTTIFWYLTIYSFDNKILKLKGLRCQKIYNWIRAHHIDLLLLWFMVVTILIIKHFWYYYRNHL